MAHSSANPFKWRQHKGKLILLCVRWYLAFTLSYRQLARMVQEHGWKVNHTSIFRWVQRYGPEVAARCRAFLTPTNLSFPKTGSVNSRNRFPVRGERFGTFGLTSANGSV